MNFNGKAPGGEAAGFLSGGGFFFAWAFRAQPEPSGGRFPRPSAAAAVLRTAGAAPSQAHSRVITPTHPASSTAPKRSSIQKTHLLSTQRST